MWPVLVGPLQRHFVIALLHTCLWKTSLLFSVAADYNDYRLVFSRLASTWCWIYINTGEIWISNNKPVSQSCAVRYKRFGWWATCPVNTADCMNERTYCLKCIIIDIFLSYFKNISTLQDVLPAKQTACTYCAWLWNWFISQFHNHAQNVQAVNGRYFGGPHVL